MSTRPIKCKVLLHIFVTGMRLASGGGCVITAIKRSGCVTTASKRRGCVITASERPGCVAAGALFGPNAELITNRYLFHD